MPSGKWVFDSNAPVVFDELQSRRLLDVIPSSTFSSHQVRKDDSRWNGTRTRGDFGVSVKYGVTSAVTLDATVNPDFSQVESDAFEVEVNQRFPVFFSEKRPFFMEGLGLFNIAGTNGDATMRVNGTNCTRSPLSTTGVGETSGDAGLVLMRAPSPLPSAALAIGPRS